LEAQRSRKSEQLSKEQLALFEELWKAQQAEEESEEAEPDPGGDEGAQTPRTEKASVRKPLPSHLVRERIVHDLTDSEKRCQECGKDLRLIGEDKSERYEYIPATMKVIEDVRLRYACDCTVKAAEKPAQPIEKSTAGASLLAQVVVSQFCDHQPLHRQEQMCARHGVEISRQTMCGWMASVASLAMPLYETAKKVLFDAKVIGTDDTGVKVLDPQRNFARTGRIWPYVGDAHHPQGLLILPMIYTQQRFATGSIPSMASKLKSFAI